MRRIWPGLPAIGAGLFFYLLYLITKGKGMGLGDVKLAALMGLVLGYPKIVYALYSAFLTGAVFGVILIISKRKKIGQVIAFGPFLAAAACGCVGRGWAGGVDWPCQSGYSAAFHG